MNTKNEKFMNLNLFKIGFCSLVASSLIVNTAFAQSTQQEAANKIATAKEKMQVAVQKVNEERKLVFEKVAVERNEILAELKAEHEQVKAKHATELEAVRQYKIEKTAELKANREAVKAEIARKRSERELKNEE